MGAEPRIRVSAILRWHGRMLLCRHVKGDRQYWLLPGGGVNSDVPVTIQGQIETDSLRGEMNGGGALLRLRSSGGGVRLTGISRSAAR